MGVWDGSVGWAVCGRIAGRHGPQAPSYNRSLHDTVRMLRQQAASDQALCVAREGVLLGLMEDELRDADATIAKLREKLAMARGKVPKCTPSA